MEERDWDCQNGWTWRSLKCKEQCSLVVFGCVGGRIGEIGLGWKAKKRGKKCKTVKYLTDPAADSRDWVTDLWAAWGSVQVGGYEHPVPRSNASWTWEQSWQRLASGDGGPFVPKISDSSMATDGDDDDEDEDDVVDVMRKAWRLDGSRRKMDLPMAVLWLMKSLVDFKTLVRLATRLAGVSERQ
jgi:hypothetical protein